jgi:hypothetical protein
MFPGFLVLFPGRFFLFPGIYYEILMEQQLGRRKADEVTGITWSAYEFSLTTARKR